jgi:hypothetical protein
MKNLKDLIDTEDILTFGGLLLIGVGCGLIYLPVGFIVVGMGLFGIGLGWFIRIPRAGEEPERIEQIEPEREGP